MCDASNMNDTNLVLFWGKFDDHQRTSVHMWVGEGKRDQATTTTTTKMVLGMHAVRTLAQHRLAVCRICRLVHSRQRTQIQNKQINSTFWHQTWWLKLIESWSVAKKKRCYYGMNTYEEHILRWFHFRCACKSQTIFDAEIIVCDQIHLYTSWFSANRCKPPKQFVGIEHENWTLSERRQ